MAKSHEWYEITNQHDGDDPPEIYIYDQIGESFLSDGVSAKGFIDDLQSLGDVPKINLRINSPGGSAWEAFAIYNGLIRNKAEINVHVDGLAASAASVVAMAGDTIVMPENAMMMIHDPSGVAMGGADDMRTAADRLEKVKKGIISAYRNKSGQTTKAIAAIMSAETWFTAQEALDAGFADEVGEPARIAASFDLSRFEHAPESFKSVVAKAPTTARRRPKTMAEKTTQKLPDITREYLDANAPDVVSAILDEGRLSAGIVEVQSAANIARDEGAEAERDRIKAVEDQLIPGHETLIATLKWDGKTTGPEAAVQVLQAEKASRTSMLDNLKADGDKTKDVKDLPSTTSKIDTSGLPLADRCKAKWDKSAELREEFGDDLRAYTAYESAAENGQVRILSTG